jgi:hypothetical protein
MIVRYLCSHMLTTTITKNTKESTKEVFWHCASTNLRAHLMSSVFLVVKKTAISVCDTSGAGSQIAAIFS